MDGSKRGNTGHRRNNQKKAAYPRRVMSGFCSSEDGHPRPPWSGGRRLLVVVVHDLRMKERKGKDDDTCGSVRHWPERKTSLLRSSYMKSKTR
jgi:hypothetical protein